jgi:3-deoxy-D-manno-octulosonic-acid transferase
MLNKLLIFAIGLLYDTLIIPIIILFIPLSFFTKKTNTYRRSRTTIFPLIKRLRNHFGKKPVVFYCSSVGEFEQAIPLIEKFIQDGKHIILFFHSIKGLDYCRVNFNYEAYMTPFDTFLNWTLIQITLKPIFLIINRHEFWPGAILSSFIFSKLYIINFINKRTPDLIDKFAVRLSKTVFTTNENSVSRTNLMFTGDTRTDRLLARHKLKKNKIQEYRDIIRKNLPDSHRLILVGNCYSKDLEILITSQDSIYDRHRFLIISSRNGLDNKLTNGTLQMNSVDSVNWTNEKIAVFNTTGNLFELYGCADLAWVGGGFTNGIHNCLEPHFFNIPIISGPNLNGQPEALLFKNNKTLHIFENAKQLNELLATEQLFSQTRSATHKEQSPTDQIFKIINESNYSC